MKRHSLKILGGGFILLLITVLFTLRKKDAETPSPDVAVQKHEESHAEVKAPAPTTQPIPVPVDASERDKKVVGSLNKFMERTDGITAESIAAEREKVKEGLKKSLERPTETPKTTVVTDENGDKWEKLEYNDGIVRYVPIASTLSRND